MGWFFALDFGNLVGTVNVLLRFFLLGSFLFLGEVPALVAQEQGMPELPRESIRAIQEKAVAEPFAEAMVCAKGVVTWVDKAMGRQFFVQDNSGGIQVTFEDGAWPELGQALEVQGTLMRGPFSPIIAKATFRHAGEAPFLYARRASGGGLLNGAYNGEFVEVDGWVRTGRMENPTTWIALLDSGGARITVRISNLPGNFEAQKWIGANVRVRGVVSPSKARGVMRQLVEVQVLAAHPDAFYVYSKEQPRDPWRQVVVPLHSVFQYHPGYTRGQRMRVQGTVIHRQGDTAYLHDGESGLAVRGSDVAALKPGAWVEAVGFLDIEDFLPVLSDSEIRPAAGGPGPVEPEERSPKELLDGLQHANYVAIRGQVLDRLETPRLSSPATGYTSKKNLTLVLQSSGSIFNAEVESNKTGPLLPQVEIGSTVRVKGVCLAQTDSSGNVFSFKILAPDPGQITVIRAASFFTVKRLLVLLSVSLAVLLIVLSAASLLARRHTALLAKMQERQTIEAERNRLARELHDTLEQGLTGVQMQLKGMELAPEEGAPQRQERLQTIRTLIQQCHDEIRHCIWNLRSAALDHVDLGEALKRMAQLLAAGSSLQVDLRQERAPVSIPALIEDNLLRIGQEAITNSIKHADATEIKINLIVTHNHITLTLTDNGNGITEPKIGTGHFGLVGMRERAARIGGRLVIAGKPKGGCIVRVDVPFFHDSSTTSS